MFALLALLATLHLTAKDNNKHFTVKPHEAIVMTLATTPGTGYHWQYVHSPGSGKVVKLISHRYIAPKNGQPGAAGKEVWHFGAVAKGKIRLEFDDLPPGSTTPAESVGIAIRVS
jgi:predicted secreted protein